MKIKSFLNFILLFFVLFFGVCQLSVYAKAKSVILFNKEPINTTTIQASTNLFELGDTTHYVLYVPKGFKSPYLRMQIVKKDTKTMNWGYSINRAQNIKIDTSKNYYIDSVKMSQPGFYIVSFYYLNDLVHPISRANFTVK